LSAKKDGVGLAEGERRRKSPDPHEQTIIQIQREKSIAIKKF